MQLQDSTSILERDDTHSRSWPLWSATLRVLFVLGMLTWWLSVLTRVTANIPSSMNTPSLLRPGVTQLPDSRVEFLGDWVVQTLGTESFVATRVAGDRLRFEFVGTELGIVVRAGPDAGSISIQIREGTGKNSATRQVSTVLNLERPSARVETFTLGRNLAPGVHVAEIRNEDSAELALTAIIVYSRPGIWWAWLPPLGLGLLALGASFYAWWSALATALGWWKHGN
ncbi:MAG: hypothetical protein ACK42I_01155 [Thermomicrobium sp.]